MKQSMKNVLLIFTIVAMMVGTVMFLLSCVSGTGTTPFILTGALSDIPNLDTTERLPSSLSNPEEAAAPSPPSPGDIEVITPSEMDAIKSEGWYRFKESFQSSPIKGFVEILKTYAETYDIEMRVPYSVGTQSIEIEGPEGVTTDSVDLGKFIVTQPESAKYVVYWVCELPFGVNGANITYYMMLTIERVAGNNFIFTMMVKEADPTFFFYSSFASATGEMLNYNVGSQSGMEWEFLDKVIQDPSTGAMTILNIQGDGSGNVAGAGVAWGSDLYGGIIQTHTSDWGGGTAKYVFTEYFNSSGNFVFRTQGETTGYFFSWLDSISASNIASGFPSGAPDTIAVRMNWGTSDYEYQKEDGSWVDIPGFGTSVYSVKWDGGTVGTWESGDAIYWWGKYGGYSDPWYLYTFELGFQVPNQLSYFGDSYYMQNEWPLKYCSLSGDYSGYQILREEGITYYGFYNPTTGESDDQLTTQTEGYLNCPSEYRWSWTNYDWWLDNDGTQSVNTDDIRMNNCLNSYTVYCWDGSELQQTKASFVTSTKDTPPSYFTFGSAQQAIVDAVDANLSTIYDTHVATTFSIATYKAYRDTFPALTNWPSLD